MKRILIFVLALGLFTSCNNDKGTDKKANYREKDDYSNSDDKDKEDDAKDKSKKNDESNFSSSDGWSETDRTAFLNECVGSMRGNQNGNAICSCVLGKAEKKYSSLAEADRVGKETAGKEMATQCLAELNISAGNNNSNTNDDFDNSTTSGGGWPESEIQGFSKTCVARAQKEGLKFLDAQSYCDCMQYKLEKMFPDINDPRLKNLNMNTTAMKKMAQNCLSEH